GLLRAMPRPDKQKYTRPLRAMRGQLPILNQPPVGCVFSPRCEAFQPGLCDAETLPLQAVSDGLAVHYVRCARWQDIAVLVATAEAAPAAPMELGEDILRVEALRKYYTLASRLFRRLCGDKGGFAKANESITFTARKREIVALVGESGSGKST